MEEKVYLWCKRRHHRIAEEVCLRQKCSQRRRRECGIERRQYDSASDKAGRTEKDVG